MAKETLFHVQVSTPHPAFVRRFFRAFVLDIGHGQLEAATWVAVALVGIWASFVGAGVHALDSDRPPAATQPQPDAGQAADGETKAEATPLRAAIAQNIHQVRPA